jgi:hypothetical protein
MKVMLSESEKRVAANSKSNFENSHLCERFLKTASLEMGMQAFSLSAAVWLNILSVWLSEDAMMVNVVK